MSPPASYRGLPVSEGVAVGEIHLADAATAAHATPEQVRAAFAAVAADRSALADRLRAAGRDEAADIVGVGALIAADPALVEPAAAAAGEGTEAGAAVHRAAAAQAAVLAALSTPEL
ncbi:MAG TPA: phosphoenolpyruvate-utilizing N-terminal domain-containing protein, partial [Actinomycetota bacterium]|nr:phosphoenolpyruvate-utilizing N-terminal domain-containing protein [Actinomycetota bacterium]